MNTMRAITSDVNYCMASVVDSQSAVPIGGLGYFAKVQKRIVDGLD